MCLCRGRRNLEEHFPYHNWLIVLPFQLLISTCFSVMTSSIYQFVTTPRSLPEEQENDEESSIFWPGLGGTDTDYAWVISAYPIFETALMPIAGLIADRLQYTVLVLLFIFVFFVGGALYAVAENIWIVFLGRGLMGGAASFCAAVVHMYIGEMGTIMDEVREKQGKRPMKFAVYIAYSFILNGGFAVPYAFTAIMAQFPSVNPYRWPGWFLAVQSVVTGFVVVLFFWEPRSLSRMKRPCKKCSCLTGLQLSAQLKSQWKTRFLCYIFLVACGYIIGQVYAITVTLITPVLSDQFGFDVEFTSYFLTGTGIAFFSASIFQLGSKAAKVDNRILLGIAFIFVLVGSLLMGDWQSINGNSSCMSTNAESIEDMFSNSTSNSSLCQQWCEALSNSSHQCFWNPKSRVTGEFCNTCLSTCLSEQASLNFYQFGLGVVLICISGPLGFVFISAITSDVTSVESQGALLSLVLGSGAFSRAVSPFMFVESYELTGRHTYPSMAITAGGSVVILICLVVLYKSLAPRSSRTERDLVVDATSKLPIMEQDFPGLEMMFAEEPQASYRNQDDSHKESEGISVSCHNILYETTL